MNIDALIGHCQQSGITLEFDSDGGIKCRGDRDKVAEVLPAIRQHKPELIRALGGKKYDLEALAQAIAHPHGITQAQALSILDADDIEAIEAGSDPGRADAWRCAVDLLVAEGALKPEPKRQLDPKPVMCGQCRYALPTGHPMLLKCGLGHQALGPAGWWATDSHRCDGFGQRDAL